MLFWRKASNFMPQQLVFFYLFLFISFSILWLLTGCETEKLLKKIFEATRLTIEIRLLKELFILVKELIVFIYEFVRKFHYMLQDWYELLYLSNF